MVRRPARLARSSLEPLALVAATLLAYSPAWQGGVLWDDNAHLTRSDLQSTAGLWRIWFDVGATQQYYPATHSAFWLMHRLWGDATLGYHLVNILLHVCSALLLKAILSRLAIPGGFLAAVIFALHPVAVESVAWMTELKNTLSTAFYLSAALSYLRFDRRRRASAYVAALAFFALALLSKSVTAVLPAAILVVFWWQRGTINWRRDVWPLLPFFALGASYGLLTAWFERVLNGAQGIEFRLEPLDRLLVAGRAIWFYLETLMWPRRLVFIYPKWKIDATSWSQYLNPAAVIVGLGMCWLIRRRTRALLAASLLYCGTLVPALGFFDVYPFRYSYVADHFQYLASSAMFTLLAASITAWLSRTSVNMRRAEAIMCLAIGAPLSVLTWQQAHDYADARTLYETTLRRNAECWLCHNNLATAKLHGSEADLSDAIAHLHESLRIYPDDAEAHNNMGGVYQRLERYEEAIHEHEEALRLNPQLVEARYNIGVCNQALNRLNEARAQYVEAIRVQPDYTMAHYNLGTTLTALGVLDQAEAEFRQALRLMPEFAPAHDGLGYVLMQTGRIPDAVTEFKDATRIAPDYAPAHYKLAVTLAGAGLADEALEEFREAVRYAPASPEMHFSLGAALASAGLTGDAEVEFREALRLRPEFPEARHALDQVRKLQK